LRMRTFIRLSEVGVCDDEGKRTAMTIGFKGKAVAPEDKPMEHFVGTLVGRVCEVVGWSSAGAAYQDIDKAIQILQDMKANVQ
jgi:hypothetical protein